MSLPLLIVVMTVPLLMYTLGLFKARQYEYGLALICFGVGLVFDWLGTLNMFWRSGRMVWSFHPLLGLTAVSLVTLELGNGLIGLLAGRERILLFFRGAAPWVYGLWLVSYLTGLISHTILRKP